MDKCSLKYVDWRPIYFSDRALKYYPGGLVLPDKDNIIHVTEREKRQLLKRRNGDMPCYVEADMEEKKPTEDK